MSNIGCKQGEVNIFDTMYTEVQSSSISIIASLAFCNLPSLKMNTIDVAKQTNSSDCGVLAVAIAFDLCSGMDPLTVRYNPRGIRPHLMECRRTFSFTRFHVKTANTKSDVIQRCAYLLHVQDAGNKELETDPMVECDACASGFIAVV